MKGSTSLSSKVRPSSASGKLESHPSFYTNFFDQHARPPLAAGGVVGRRPATTRAPYKYLWQQDRVTEAEPKDLVKQRRRFSEGFEAAAGAVSVGVVKGLGHTRQPSGGFSDGTRIEERINIRTLRELEKAFHVSGNLRQLDLEHFKAVLKEQLEISDVKEQQLETLFMKIDWSSAGSMTWDEFCSYMQLEYTEREELYHQSRKLSFHLPAHVENIPHREPVSRLTGISDGTIVACSQAGLVTFWTPGLELKRARSVVNPSQERFCPKWITDFIFMSHYNKFLVCTGDREIQIFELSSFAPYCQISNLESIPLRLDYSDIGPDQCIILFGDSEGNINILVIHAAGECLRMWKKMAKHDNYIASISLDAVVANPNIHFIRWAVHRDWVQQLKYYHGIQQVISCSNHSDTALVIGCTAASVNVEQQLRAVREAVNNISQQERLLKSNPNSNLLARPRPEHDQTVFKIYKGVKCFEFSKKKNLLVTGGMDRIVRIWNPYVALKPSAILRGHNTPVCFVAVAEDDDRIFSVSTDKCIKAWDGQDYNCLITIRPKSHRIRGDLNAIFYSSATKSLAFTSDQIAILSLKLKRTFQSDIITSHRDAVSCCAYNSSFSHIITCSTGSVVKVWDFETGTFIFEFGEAHGESTITCLLFDNTQRRLITGGEDGNVKIWNYNNGHCLRVLKKEKRNKEICDIEYVELNKNRYVVSVGWDRKINIYPDDVEATFCHVQHPLPHWKDDLMHGHKEDILAVAQSLPNLLATASYDGEIIVWNLVSGYVFCHLEAPIPSGYEDISMDGDMSINKLLFFNWKINHTSEAQLIASGPRGCIHFWNVYSGKYPLSQFPGSKSKGAMVTSMAVDSDCITLYSSDSHGFVSVWNISGYCSNGQEKKPPEILFCWRGHTNCINCITLVNDKKVIITASSDCTARLWTTEGAYIGTFGQPDPWDIYNPSTYQHPMIPYDVLIDPNSLPDHPIFDKRPSRYDTTHSDHAFFESKEQQHSKNQTSATISGKLQIPIIDDDAVAELLKNKPFNKGTGKRLKYEKLKPVKVGHGGRSDYQTLQCYPLVEAPCPNPPKLKLKKNDPFDFDIA